MQNKRASPDEVDMVSVSNFGVQVLKVYNNNSEMRGKIMESESSIVLGNAATDVLASYTSCKKEHTRKHSFHFKS